MLTRDRIFEEASKVLKEGSLSLDGVEVVVTSERTSTVRFANSVFRQGASETDCDISVRVISGRKAGVATANLLEGAALKDCLRQARDIAAHSSEEPFELRLPSRSDYPAVESYFDSTAALTSGGKVGMLSRGFIEAGRSGVLQSGAFTTAVGEVAVVNTNGVEAYHPYTSAHLSVVSTADEASGFKSALSKDASRIDVRSVMAASAASALEARGAKDLKPGVYRVLLEPAAAGELLQWLSYIGFGAKAFHEGTSFLSGSLGGRVAGQNVTIYDDGLDPAGMPVPFDMEGTPKKRTAIIENGVAKAVVYDSFSASAYGRETTGHGVFPEDTEGPVPAHLFMEPGCSSAKELLDMLGTGLLIRAFHYVNGLLNSKETLMTGMTRHGAFYVEGGKIKYPVRPLRFTENIIGAFSRIEGISAETGLFPNDGAPLSSISAPHLLMDGFTFTG